MACLSTEVTLGWSRGIGCERLGRHRRHHACTTETGCPAVVAVPRQVLGLQAVDADGDAHRRARAGLGRGNVRPYPTNALRPSLLALR